MSITEEGPARPTKRIYVTAPQEAAVIHAADLITEQSWDHPDLKPTAQGLHDLVAKLKAKDRPA